MCVLKERLRAHAYLGLCVGHVGVERRLLYFSTFAIAIFRTKLTSSVFAAGDAYFCQQFKAAGLECVHILVSCCVLRCYCKNYYGSFNDSGLFASLAYYDVTLVRCFFRYPCFERLCD